MSFKIDLHVHSKYSGDSAAEPEDIVLHAIASGLQGIAFTEHYSYEASEPVEGLREKYKDRIRIFRGVEFSAQEGHCLVFGVNTDKLCMKYLPSQDLIRIVTKAGGVVVPSHPYRRGQGMGDMILRLDGICAVEGHNGFNMNSYNDMAVQMAKAMNLPYTGGSDAHEPREAGLCYTEFEDEVTYDNFIDLLKMGKYQGIDNRKRR